MKKQINIEVIGNDIFANENDKTIIIRVFNENTVQILDSKGRDYVSFATDVKQSYPFTVSGNAIIFSNKKIIINENLLLDFYQDDALVSSDVLSSYQNTAIDDSILALEGHEVSQNDHYEFLVTKKINKDDAIYGLGDKTGFINKRSYEYINWNTDNPNPQVDSFKSLYKSIPFFIVKGEKSYGIFLDNTYKSLFNFGQYKDDEIVFGSTGGYLNYYFFFGDMKEIIKEYTALTGRTPLPQRRALGYHQSRWSYANKAEVLDLVSKFKEYNIPLECVHLDIDYMDNYKVFTTSEEKFPQIKEMIEDLKKQGVKIVMIIDPGVKAEKGYFVYDEGIRNDYFAIKENEVYHNAVWPGDSVFPSFTNTEVKKWWGGLTKKITDLGIMGIWNDMNEPASFNGPIELDVKFKTDSGYKYHKEVHNVFGHEMAKATFDGIKENTGNRPFIITRACYAGTQKFSTGWTGDNHSIWAHLEMAIPQLCNLGMSGMTFVGTDVGGFGSDCTKELLIRWIEMAVFSPLLRNHAAYGTRRQEPWTFDDECIDIYRKFVNMRYEFIPYIYDLFYKAQETGLPIMRPLVLEYPHDPEVLNISDEYMVGSDILVAPITKLGANNRLVYLPNGLWIDYNTNKVLQGGHHIIYDAPLDTLPMFIKYNSIIPKYSNTNIENPDEIIFNCYGEKATYTHYSDNGLDYSFEDGEYTLYEVNFDEDVTITTSHHGYKEYSSIKTNIIKGN